MRNRPSVRANQLKLGPSGVCHGPRQLELEERHASRGYALLLESATDPERHRRWSSSFPRGAGRDGPLPSGRPTSLGVTLRPLVGNRASVIATRSPRLLMRALAQRRYVGRRTRRALDWCVALVAVRDERGEANSSRPRRRAGAPSPHDAAAARWYVLRETDGSQERVEGV